MYNIFQSSFHYYARCGANLLFPVSFFCKGFLIITSFQIHSVHLLTLEEQTETLVDVFRSNARVKLDFLTFLTDESASNAVTGFSCKLLWITVSPGQFWCSTRTYTTESYYL